MTGSQTGGLKDGTEAVSCQISLSVSVGQLWRGGTSGDEIDEEGANDPRRKSEKGPLVCEPVMSGNSTVKKGLV